MGNQKKKYTAISTLIMTLLVLAACETEQKKKMKSYNGPLREMENVDVVYNEKEKVKMKLKAKKIVELQSGDREFPDGLYIEFFDELSGEMSSTLKANHAYYFKTENKWRGRGKVEVKNIAKQQQLNTEELFWKQDTKKIFTDKFVTIRDMKDVIYGTGLDADQNLTYYTITKPEGEFEVKDGEPANP